MFSRSLFANVEEHGAGAGPVSDQRAVGRQSGPAGTGDPLLDDAAAKLGVDRSVIGALDRLSQATVGYPLPARIPHHPFGFEDAHAIS